MNPRSNPAASGPSQLRLVQTPSQQEHRDPLDNGTPWMLWGEARDESITDGRPVLDMYRTKVFHILDTSPRIQELVRRRVEEHKQEAPLFLTLYQRIQA